MKAAWLSWLVGMAIFAAAVLAALRLRQPPDRGSRVPPAGPYWSRDAATVLDHLGSGRPGLASTEAARRLHLYGLNSVEDQPRTVAARLFARQFQSPLVLILVFGAVISLFLLDWVDAAIILAIVLGSAVLGFTQDTARAPPSPPCAVGSPSRFSPCAMAWKPRCLPPQSCPVTW